MNTMAGAGQVPVYWTVRRFNEPVPEWAERMAVEYAKHNPAILARLDQIERAEGEQEDGP